MLATAIVCPTLVSARFGLPVITVRSWGLKPTTQWAAERILVGEITEPPQCGLPLSRIATMNGQSAGLATPGPMIDLWAPGAAPAGALPTGSDSTQEATIPMLPSLS